MVLFAVLIGVLIEARLWFIKMHYSKRGVSAQVQRQERINKAEVNQKMVKLHIPFIINNGQTDKEVRFYANTFGGMVFVTKKGEVVYSLSKVESKDVETQNFASLRSQSTIQNPQLIRRLALKEEFVGGKVEDIKGGQKSITKVSYFKGNDRSKWKTNISTYDLVSLGEVYKGVELKLRAYGKNVEKLFYVKSGADPESIRVKLSGGKLNVNENGELEVKTELGTVKFSKPLAYQEVEGKREFVEAGYVVRGDEYSFKVGDYDKEKELVIDPVLASTFLGGSGSPFDEVAFAITFDSQGNVYVAGATFSSNFPGIGAGSAQSTLRGLSDAFIAKLNPDLSSILAATFLGGNDNNGEQAFSITLDSTGNVYVAGVTTASDFPGIGSGSADKTFAGEDEGFVAKLNSDLSSLLASTYLGGSSNDLATAITLDNQGNVYVTGNTHSSNFPGIGAGSADSTFAGADESYVVELNSGLSSILAATFLGGSGEDLAFAIIIDSAGNVYVAGGTTSSDFPGVGAGSADSTFAGGSEGFVAKLNPGLSSILASTFLGGSNADAAFAIALDGQGNVYVAGGTTSSDFPGVGAGSADSTFAGSTEAFVAKLNPGLGSILASTFLGGRGDDLAFAITLDSTDNVYVSGETTSSDFPGVGSGSAQGTLRGPSDAFVSELNTSLSSILASTFLGGSSGNSNFVNNVLSTIFQGFYLGGVSDDMAIAITLDSADNVYVAGFTGSRDFPGVGSGSADKTFGGVEEAFVAELDPNLSAPGGPTPTPTATPTGSPKPTASPTSSPMEISSPGNCSIGGPADIGTGIANVLMPLLPAFAIGLRAIMRRTKK